MLPFLKNRMEASASEPVAKIEIHGEDYGLLDAIAEDLLTAFEQKDKKMLKEALESLCDHIKNLDETQDMEDKE